MRAASGVSQQRSATVKLSPRDRRNAVLTELDLSSLDIRVPGGDDVVRVVLRDHDQVRVGYSKPVINHSHAFRARVEHEHGNACQSLRLHKHVAGETVRQIGEVIYVLPRD